MESDNFNLLTETECVEILKNTLKCDSSKFKLISSKVVPVSNPTVIGFLGEYFNLMIYAKIGNDLQSRKFEYFIKSVPITDALQTKLIEKHVYFPKETGLYSSLFKDMDKYKTSKWHPTCFYVRPDILVMEDLHKLNYRILDDCEVFSLEQLRIVLKRLASMHASSIIFEERTGVNIGERYEELSHEVSIIPGAGWFHAGLKATQAVAYTVPKFQKEEIKKFISEDFMSFEPKMVDMVKSSTKYRNVLCHRDLWAKNLLFKYDGEHPVDCVFVDFQLCRYHPPGVDVLQCIYLNTDRKTRDANLNDLLEFYYECLRRDLKSAEIDVAEHLTWNAFTENCEEVRLLPLMLSGVYTHMGNLPDGYVYDFRKKDPEGYHSCVIEDRTDFVFQRMQEDEKYKQRNYECAEEVVEYMMKRRTYIK